MQAPSRSWRLSKKSGSYLLPGLQRIRHERELSIRELASKAGVSPDTIWRVESLQRGAEPKTRRKIALALETTMKNLRTPDEEVDEET